MGEIIPEHPLINNWKFVSKSLHNFWYTCSSLASDAPRNMIPQTANGFSGPQNDLCFTSSTDHFRNENGSHFFCILGMSKALCGQQPSVWWSAGSSAPANLYAVWSVCSTRLGALGARGNFSLWGVIWWPEATDMMDVLNRIDSLFEYFIHIDSISILCQADLLQSWWVTQQFQGS